jgi:polysaccharide export outer membrane protein
MGKCVQLFGGALLSLLLMAPAHAADFVVQPGDVLEVDVFGAPGLHRKAPIDPDGRFSMPFAGDISAAGLTLAELRTKLRDTLIEKNIVRDPGITIDVVEYRPVYVSGDVGKPGVYPYHPGMTVRDAVTLAEGYDLLRLRGRDPILDSVDARESLQAAVAEQAKEIVRSARINAELAGRTELDLSAAKELGVQPSLLSEVVRIETDQLTANNQNAAREKESLNRTITALQDQIATLSQQETSAAAALDDQKQTIERARKLMEGGLLSQLRMEDDQRAEAAAQNLLFDVQSRGAQARRELEDAKRRLEVADDQRRMQLLQDLRNSVAAVAAAQVKLAAAAERIRYTGAAQARVASDATAEPPRIVIYGFRDGKRRTIADSDEDAAIQPGDNIQITTRSQLLQLLRPDLPAPASSASK